MVGGLETVQSDLRVARVAGVLLLGQALALVAVIAYWTWSAGLVDVVAGVGLETVREVVAGEFVVLLPPALLGLLAAAALLLRLRLGWLLAMLTQMAILLVSLVSYLEGPEKPRFLYPMMLYGVLMTFYLNSYHVRVVFHARPAADETGLPHE